MNLAPFLLLFAFDPPGEVTFRLDNGLKVILAPRAGQPVAVVALGVEVGVHNEPEGRCGISHLAEHLFIHGASKSYAANKAFDALGRGGPLESAYQNANAETMWNLTYFYAARRADSVDEALQIFAEKLSGVVVTQDVLDVERTNVLAEIQNVAALPPAMRKQMEQEVRYPKAGIESHVKDLEIEHVEAYLAAHYRPERATLVVLGAIDPAALRQPIETHFAPCRARASHDLAEGTIQDIPEQWVFTIPCEQADERERAALRVASAAWESRLRKQARAYVETVPGGSLRATLLKDDPALLSQTRAELSQPLDEQEFPRARARAGQKARMMKFLGAQHGDPAKAGDAKAASQILVQAAIDRLRFEAEGGQALLDLLETISADEVAAAAKKFLRTEPEQPRHLQPERTNEGNGLPTK
jgi:Insulinase (Peptidase family M16)/Peptidase M16 inactive domain